VPDPRRQRFSLDHGGNIRSRGGVASIIWMILLAGRWHLHHTRHHAVRATSATGGAICQLRPGQTISSPIAVARSSGSRTRKLPACLRRTRSYPRPASRDAKEAVFQKRWGGMATREVRRLSRSARRLPLVHDDRPEVTLLQGNARPAAKPARIGDCAIQHARKNRCRLRT